MSKREAVAAIVTGHDERVGFRALVMKQAIQYNLAGLASNQPNNIVHFSLQGRKKRIDAALHTIQKGTKRSSDIKIKTVEASFDPALDDFTIPDWTSSSRDITTKYTLVFKLRPDDEELTPLDAEAAWHKILAATLDPADLRKLQPDD
jgi:acylphosphatase